MDTWPEVNWLARQALSFDPGSLTRFSGVA